MSGRTKGQDFEREICRQLSMWWSRGTESNVFWRSAASGGRATNNSARGKGTYGSYGDIAAVHPSGRGLLDKVTLELKCGYKNDSSTVTHLLDKPQGAVQQMFEAFLEQAHEAAHEANTEWMLITKRDKRQPFVFMSCGLFSLLKESGSKLYATTPLMRMKVAVRFKGKGMIAGVVPLDIWGTTLANFFEVVNPEHFS